MQDHSWTFSKSMKYQAEILKVAEDSLVRELAILHIKISASGTPLADWQTAIVKCIAKMCDLLDWKNYRPISFLSVVAKVFESVLAVRHSKLFDDNALISAEQV